MRFLHRFAPALEILEKRFTLDGSPLLWFEDNNLGSAGDLPSDFIKRFDDPETWQRSLRVIDTMYLRESSMRNSTNGITPDWVNQRMVPVLNQAQTNIAIDSNSATFLTRRKNETGLSYDSLLHSHFSWLDTLVQSGLRIKTISLQSILSKTPTGDPSWETYPLADRVKDFVEYGTRLLSRYPSISVGIIDALPTHARDWRSAYSQLRTTSMQNGLAVDHIHLDMPTDWVGPGTNYPWEYVVEVQQYVQGLHSKFGLLLTNMTGGTTSNDLWAQRTIAGLGGYQDAIRRVSNSNDQPDRIIVSSWYPFPDRSVPETMPDPIDSTPAYKIRNTTQVIVQASNLLRGYKDYVVDRVQDEYLHILPVTASASSTSLGSNLSPENAVFARGIVDATESQYQFQWQPTISDSNPWIKGTWIGLANVERIRIWPLIHWNGETAGVSTADVYFSSTGVGDPVSTPAHWTFATSISTAAGIIDYTEARFSIVNANSVAIRFRNPIGQPGIAAFRIFSPNPAWNTPYRSPLVNSQALPDTEVVSEPVYSDRYGAIAGTIYVNGSPANLDYNLTLEDTRFVIDRHIVKLKPDVALTYASTKGEAVWVLLQSRINASLRHYKLVSFLVYPPKLNGAPVLDSANPNFGSVLEGATNTNGMSVASIVVDGSIREIEGVATEAIAITGLNSTLGRWQYRLEGGTGWLTILDSLINSQTNEMALLLGPKAHLRLVPFGDLNGLMSDGITFRAWDRTTGNEGEYVPIATTGGTSAFSSNTNKVSVTVTAVNDPPIFKRGDGIVTTRFNATGSVGNGVVLQPDGKIIVGGYVVFGLNYDFALVRYNPDGSLDSSFGTGGKVTTTVGTSDEWGASIALQTDGKIILGGWSFNGNDYDFAVVRFNADGSLDSTFGNGGKITTAIGAGYDVGNSITLQPDGKIIIGGGIKDGAFDNFALVRYLPNGSLDVSFGTGGKVVTTVSSGNDFGTSVLVQADGKIVVGGYAAVSGTEDFALVRYNPNGSLDASFGNGGVITTPIGSGNERGTSVAIQTDGKIVLGGWSSNEFAIVRYNVNGSLDSTFGVGGKTTTRFGLSSFGSTLTLQPDGKILIGGWAEFNDDDFALVRYNSDGSTDGNLLVKTRIGTGSDRGYSVTCQPDGKILLAGGAFNGTSLEFALARYNYWGDLDTTFDLVSTLGGSVSYTENGNPVILDSDISAFDAELSSRNFNQATLTLVRSGGSNAQDIFSATGTLGQLSQGGSLMLGSTVIGSVTANNGGILALTFNANANGYNVNMAMRQIAYSNSSDSPPASVQIDWIFSDGNTGEQGSGGILVASEKTTVVITSVNDTPTDIVLSSNLIAENSEANATVGFLSTLDPDQSTGFNYILIPGNGDTDNSDFQINSSTLSVKRSLNYEAKSIYSIRIRAMDQGQLATEKIFSIALIDINETPLDISLTPTTISENSGPNALVGILSTVDPDTMSTFSYSLVAGNDDIDNLDFVIQGSTVRAKSNFNFEVKSRYFVRIRTTDQGGLFFDRSFAITIDDRSENNFQNPHNPLDVDFDGFVTPLDVLVIVNLINATRPSIPLHQLPSATLFANVDGNLHVDPLDALVVVNYLNSGTSSGGNRNGEGEGMTYSNRAWYATGVHVATVLPNSIPQHSRSLPRYITDRYPREIGFGLLRSLSTDAVDQVLALANWNDFDENYAFEMKRLESFFADF